MQTQHLIKLAKAFGAHRGLKLSSISTYAVDDGKWLPGLRDGNGCTIKKFHRCIIWFSENWPEDLEWPSDIPRPAPEPARKEASDA